MPRAVITGVAGFIGSHLGRALLDGGWHVLGFDNMLTGTRRNLEALLQDERFAFEPTDVTNDIAVEGAVDAVLHLASPASPRDYLEFPIETLIVGSQGTRVTLDLARAKHARYLLASTSEVYGDPLVSPQPESYWGNVNPVGLRGVYDEAKRFAESLAMAYHRVHGLDVKVARIFNTYGPGLRVDDGRAIPNFLVQAIRGGPITIYGTGEQTRSFGYVDDTVRGLVSLLESGWVGPMNIGNPTEHSLLEVVELVRQVVASDVDIAFCPLPEGDPRVRCPDVTLARSVLGWEPEVSLRDGLFLTHRWLERELAGEAGGADGERSAAR